MLAAGLLENRRLVAKIAVTVAALFMLPILVLMMLPVLIFGTGGLDSASGDVLNDNSLIMENIAGTESSIEAILRERHDAVLSDIQKEADAIGNDCEYSITDEFSDRIVYESALIISQFCASQEDYKEINLAKLEQLLKDNTAGIFSCSLNMTSHEETDEETGETTTVYHYAYTVEYAGRRLCAFFPMPSAFHLLS